MVLLFFSAGFQVTPARTMKRWVAPVILALNRRKKYFADKLPKLNKRSGFIEWNLDAEIYSFGKRLGEDFETSLLKRSFTQRSYVIQEEIKLEKLGVEKSDFNLLDNRDLAEKGFKIAETYISAFLKYHLPNYPSEGLSAIQNYLLSDSNLAHVSFNLGTKDIIMAAEYPPNEQSLATTLLAIIGALEESCADDNFERPYNFIRDFIVTQLNQIDVNEIWDINEPFEYLKNILAKQNNVKIEPRIIGEVSANYILSGCRIGIYERETKRCLGTGYGDTYENGIQTASIDALSNIFHTRNIRPFDYTICAQQLFGK